MDLIFLMILIVSAEARHNVALFKPTWQSSNHTESWLSPLAVDGNTDTDLRHGSCFHTKIELHPWWMVNLGKVCNIQNIAIWRRNDCCAGRTKDLEVLTGNDTETFTLCRYYQGQLPTMLSLTFHNSCVGQIVKLQLAGENFFHLCEVQIFPATVESSNDSSGNDPASSPCNIQSSWTNPATPYQSSVDTASSAFISASLLSSSQKIKPLVTNVISSTSSSLFDDIMVTSSSEMSSDEQHWSQNSIFTMSSSDTITDATPVNLEASSATVTTDSFASVSKTASGIRTSLKPVSSSHSTEVITSRVPLHSAGSVSSLCQCCRQPSHPVATLKLNEAHLSKNIRKRISAPNTEPHAKYIGTVGLVSIITVLLLIVLSDCFPSARVSNRK